jgi:hypothetical protein
MITIVTDSEEDLIRRVPLTNHFPQSLAIERARFPSVTTKEHELEAAGFCLLEEEHVEFEYDLWDLEPYS